MLNQASIYCVVGPSVCVNNCKTFTVHRFRNVQRFIKMYETCFQISHAHLIVLVWTQCFKIPRFVGRTRRPLTKCIVKGQDALGTNFLFIYLKTVSPELQHQTYACLLVSARERLEERFSVSYEIDLLKNQSVCNTCQGDNNTALSLQWLMDFL